MPRRRTESPASSLPAVHTVLADPRLRDAPRAQALRETRLALGEARARTLTTGEAISAEHIVERVLEGLREHSLPFPRRVVNASGVVLHTNLGRAPLAAEARAALEAAAGYCAVELNLETGRRGERLGEVRTLLAELSGAEDALVVNNNAAAVLLALSTLARGREVLVSRGEAVEIGGSFRIPDVMAQSGAHLVEVGCTNRTRLEDYARAITPETVAILRVHRSNFRIVGFVAAPDPSALAALARERGLLLLEDLGSGNLCPELDEEPTVRSVVESGVDLACFSGDKLLGGPQSGILVGRAELVARLARHPLYRALRLDKLALAALHATLLLHRAGRHDAIPTLAMLRARPTEVRQKADRLKIALAELWPALRVLRVQGRAGGGALPERPFPSYAVEIMGLPAEDLARALREGDPPVVGRVHHDALLLDPRTLLDGDEPLLLDAFQKALSRLGPSGGREAPEATAPDLPEDPGA